jgi:hypothetical protein
MWHIDPLLSSDSKQLPLLGNSRNIDKRNNRKTMFSVVHAAAVSGQQLGKHVPSATSTNTIEERCFLCGHAEML